MTDRSTHNTTGAPSSDGKSADGSGNLTPELAFSRAIEAIYAFAADPDNYEDLFVLIEHVDKGTGQGTGKGTGENDDFSASLKRHLERAENVAEMTSTQPEVPAFGIITFDKKQRIIQANEHANRQVALLAEPLASSKPLQLRDPDSAREFKSALESLDANHVGLVRLHDRSQEHTQLALLAGSAVAANLAPTIDRSEPVYAALVLPTALAQLENTTQADLLGLTPAENRLAMKLQEGLSLKEAADALSIAHNTARNQLQNLFTKLGSRRQAELVRNLDALALLHQSIESKEKAASPVKTSFSYPDRQTMTLADGRLLAWREYGDPKGFPVLMLPSVLSTSHMPEQESRDFRDAGFRLIFVERPGRGRSTFDPLATPQSVATDIEALCNKLELEKISLFGSASGCPFTVACAIQMGTRVKAMGLIAPRLYYNAESGMIGSVPALFYGAAARRPNAAKHVLNIMRGRATRILASLTIRKIYRDQPADKAILENRPDLFDALLMNGIEAFTQQPEGIVRELSILNGGNQLDYSKLTCKILAWRGARDNHLPLKDFEEVTQSFPLPAIKSFEGAGHLILNQHSKEILVDLKKASED